MTTFIIFSFFTAALHAQEIDAVKQRELMNEQAGELRDLCDSVYGKDIRLAKGSIYFPPNLRADGHPFFKTADWMTGSVTSDGVTFTGIELNYDITHDHLVLLNEYRNGSVIRLLLSKDHVTAFTLEEHEFILMDPSTGINIPEKQYFEILFDGKVSLVQRPVKQYLSTPTQAHPYGRFTNAVVTRYIIRDGKLHRFTNRFSLYKVLADKKSEIKKYLKGHRISNVRKATDQEITKLVGYYNSIIP